MYCVLCIDSGDEGVNGEEQDSEAASDKNWACAVCSSHNSAGTKTAIKQLLPTSFIVRCLHYTREIDWATIHNWQRLWKDCHYVHLHYSFYQSSVHLCLPDATDRMQKCCSDLFPPVYGWRGWVLLVALCEECGPAEDSVNTAATSSSVQTLCCYTTILLTS